MLVGDPDRGPEHTLSAEPDTGLGSRFGSSGHGRPPFLAVIVQRKAAPLTAIRPQRNPPPQGWAVDRPVDAGWPRAASTARRAVSADTVGHRGKQQDLVTLTELIEAGKVTPVIDRCYPFGEISAAIEYQEAGHASGKVVVTV
ncbi:zinc-binding dehydrogenase [Nocardia amamiensis]|uniref:zinc-binding dehydrogenase n=1 Tax=Nocardia amamiensis TaxID=404578 RepID=UPI002B4ABF9C|nr:zinc-binding dehydrogenase [Nocardia amamiensis]